MCPLPRSSVRRRGSSSTSTAWPRSSPGCKCVEVGKKDNLTMYAIGEKNTRRRAVHRPGQGPAAGQEGRAGEAEVPARRSRWTSRRCPKDFKEPKFAANKPPPKPKFSRKDQLADWITKPDNPYFARAIANRVWAQYMGRGLVHPVDNMSPSNEPSHPELLDALAEWTRRAQVRPEVVHPRAGEQQDVSAVRRAAAAASAMPAWFQHARSAAAVGRGAGRSRGGSRPATTRRRRTRPRTRAEPLPPAGERATCCGSSARRTTATGDFQGGLREHLYLNNGPLGRLIVQ